MQVLLDSNISLRSVEPHHAQHKIALGAIG
jgi:hypothetical protein